MDVGDPYKAFTLVDLGPAGYFRKFFRKKGFLFGFYFLEISVEIRVSQKKFPWKYGSHDGNSGEKENSKKLLAGAVAPRGPR